MKLTGCAAVITGGASGLGEATARALAGAGVKVALFDINAQKGEALADVIGGVFCQVNVTQDDSVDAGLEKARDAHGQERILVNCAGSGNAIKTASRDKATGEIKHFPLDAFDRIVQINLVGTFRCIAKSAAGMLTLDPSRTTMSAVSSSTRPALPQKTGRWVRQRMPPPRPASLG
jgi:NAD(P)-dependent dehydrogenase (short-subunit alcohol dehydrogenase family)